MGQIKLAWDPNTEPDLAGYRIYYGTTSRTYGAPIDVGNVTSYTLNGLTGGVTYYIAVTAYDRSNNESGFSNEVSGKISETVSQETIPYTVTSNPPGLLATVDGAEYITPKVFNWVPGSTHSVSIAHLITLAEGIRNNFVSWSDGGTPSHTVRVPGTSQTYTANFRVENRLKIVFIPSGAGMVEVKGQQTQSRLLTASLNEEWYNANDIVNLNVRANPGYTFSGWAGDLMGISDSASLSINLPKVVVANFTVVAETVSLPRTPGGNSSGVTGVLYNFTTGKAVSNYNDPIEYQYDWQGDGSDLSVWGLAYQSKSWNVAGTYRVKARARCALHYTVVSDWSEPLEVTISEVQNSCTITTDPPGLPVSVDGGTYMSPVTFNNWSLGSSHSLSILTPQPGSAGTRYVFSSWSDGGAAQHTVTADLGVNLYVARYTSEYLLKTSVNPPEGGTVNPAGEGWYPGGQSVSFEAVPAAGYLFGGWSGDLSGTMTQTSIVMNGPKSVKANYEIGSKASFEVTPVEGMSASGEQRGPFNPSSQIFTLKNPTSASLKWKITKKPKWLTLSLSSGTLPSGATVELTASLNPNTVVRFKPGSFEEFLLFGYGAKGTENTVTRPIRLTVTPAIRTHTVTTEPEGLQVVVDGTTYTSPQSFEWEAESSHSLSTPSPQSDVPESKYLFRSWSNRKPQTQTIKAPFTVTTYKAVFKTLHALSTSADSPEGGSVSPAGTTWYVQGGKVTVTAKAASGYQFLNWSGDATGSSNPLQVVMEGPVQVTAGFGLKEEKPLDTGKGVLPLVGALEGPADGKKVLGVKTIYGWALDGEGVSRVRFYVDGEYVCDIPHGGYREDLKELYADYPNADRGGFALVWNYSSLYPGPHEVGVEVENGRGEVLRLGSRVEVLALDGEGIVQVSPKEGLIEGAQLTVNGETRVYDLKIEWSPESQSFEITDITPQ